MAERPTITTSQLGQVLLLSPRRIQQLIDEGVITRAIDPETGAELRGRFYLVQAVNAYVRYLRNQIDSSDGSETKFLDARSRRMIAVAERAELQLRVLKGKLHRAEDVEYFMSNRDSAIRARLLAISSRITRLLVGQTDPVGIRAIIDTEILAVLDELSSYYPLQFNEQNEAYLSKLFPAVAKSNGNGENESLEETEADGE